MSPNTLRNWASVPARAEGECNRSKVKQQKTGQRGIETLYTSRDVKQIYSRAPRNRDGGGARSYRRSRYGVRRQGKGGAALDSIRNAGKGPGMGGARVASPPPAPPPPPRRFGDRRSRSVSDSLERAAKEAVAGDHAIGVCAGVRQVPKLATGAFHNQTTRGDVPQPDAAFDVGVEPPGRHVTQRQRRRPHHPDLAHPADQPIEVRQGGFQAFPALGEADGNERLGQFTAPAHVNDPAVQPRWPAADGRPQLITERVEDDAH